MTTIEQTIFIKATPEAVTAVSLDLNRMAEWYVGVENVESNSKWLAIGSVTTINFKSAGLFSAAGTIFPLPFTTVEYIPNEKLTTKTKSARGTYSAMISWGFAPHNGGTTLSYKQDYELSGDHFDRATVENSFNQSVVQSLNNLKKIVEG